VSKSSAAVRVGIFAAALVVVFGGAFAAGAAIDPDAGDGDAGQHGETAAHGGDAAAHDPAKGATAPRRIVIDERDFEPGVPGTLAFQVVDRDGRAIEDFDVAHEREMHVIVARHDLTGYQHLHPRPTGNGRWAVEVSFPDAGPHRVFADFVTGGEAHTLGADVEVAGAYTPRGLQAPASSATAGDGYEVAVARGGDERRFTVTRDGRPVDDIEPYLGARGHLVALRAGSLAFQHVHPKDEATIGREIAFDVALPRAGDYRLFLQFKHDGRVRTAELTERVGTAAAPAHEEDGHGH
jgi:hypothetical protein